jgi:hypothetical protein
MTSKPMQGRNTLEYLDERPETNDIIDQEEAFDQADE